MKISGFKTVAEAARILKLDANTVRRYASSGRLVAEKVGWSLVFADAELARFKADRRPVGRPMKEISETSEK